MLSMEVTMQKGDKVLYSLRQGLDVTWIPAVVKSVGPKRVVIVDDKFKMQRIVLPEHVHPSTDGDLEHKFVPGTGTYPDYLYCQECGASESDHRL